MTPNARRTPLGGRPSDDHQARDDYENGTNFHRGPIDLTNDLHGRVVEFASDTDRRWFAEHPGQTRYRREPFDHEFCLPTRDGQCAPMFLGTIVATEIVEVAPGVRARAAVMLEGPTA